MREKKAPANTFAWLLVIILIPYVGVPLFLLFGGRKLRRLAKLKSRSSSPSFPVCSSILRSMPRGLSLTATMTSAGASPPVAGNELQLLKDGRS